MNIYWKHFPKISKELYLSECGIQQFLLDQKNHYRVREEFVIHYVMEGAGFYDVNQQHFSLQKGMGFILYAGDLVSYYPDKKDPWCNAWVSIGGSELKKWLSETSLLNTYVFTFPEYSRSKKTIHYISEFNASNPSDSVKVKLRNYELLYQLLYDLNDEFMNLTTNPENTDIKNLASNVYQYISQNYMNSLTVNDLATKFNMSRTTLYRLTMDYFQASPKELIQENRMRIAAQMLLNTNSTVKTIAKQVGYKDAYTFSKSFKNYFSYSPTAFKNLDEHTIDYLLFTSER